MIQANILNFRFKKLFDLSKLLYQIMAKEYYTTVSASEAFWERLVSEKIESAFPITLMSEGAGFTITSKNKPAIGDMIELSNEFPDESFNVIVTTNNIYKNIIEYYDFQSGATYFNHLEPLYHFDLSEEVEQMVDPDIIDEFKKEITESLERINVFVPSYEHVIGCQNQTKEIVSNIQFEYGHQNTTLSAKVIGQTFIKINIESDSNDENQILKNNIIK